MKNNAELKIEGKVEGLNNYYEEKQAGKIIYTDVLTVHNKYITARLEDELKSQGTRSLP